jgi:hypothetical protein
MAIRLESLLNDGFANREDKKGINGICENSFQLSNAKRLPSPGILSGDASQSSKTL